MESWIKALDSYYYPVDLGHFENSSWFPNHFNMKIAGDRDTTMAFENYFRKNARREIEVYFEVVFWKLYSQKRFMQRHTSRIIKHVLDKKISPESLHDSINCFVESPNRRHLGNIRDLLGIRSRVLAVALTFPAFLDPEKYPMLDRNVAQWVNNFIRRNRDKQLGLTPFTLKYTSLQDNDFQNYLNWVCWCNEIAEILTDRTNIEWRPRDVEMAIFTAKRKHLELGKII